MKNIKHKIYKTGKDFTKYLIVGILYTLLYIFLMWLFIDIFKIHTIIASTVIVFSILILKFYTYVIINLIHHRFLKYITIELGFILSNIFLAWLLIDVIHIPTVISSSIIVYCLFMLRFVVFKVSKLIK